MFSTATIFTPILKSNSLNKVRNTIRIKINRNNSELPDADFNDFDNKACEKCHYKMTRNLRLPSLPQLPGPKDKFFKVILKQKIELCKTLCDYSNPRNDLHAKQVKKNTLIELCNLFSALGVMTFVDDEIKRNLFEMIMVNLLRPMKSASKLEIFNYDISLFKLDDFEHMEQIYGIMSAVYYEFVKIHLFTPVFAIRILPVLYSKDIGERRLAISFYTTMLANDQNFIQIFPHLIKILTESYDMSPFAISSVLEILNERAKKDSRVIEEIRPYFYSHFITLLKFDFMDFYHQELLSIFDATLQYYNSMSFDVIKYIIRIWPISNPAKEVLMFDYLVKSVAYINNCNNTSLKAIFNLIGKLIDSVSFKIAEKANKSIVSQPMIGLVSRYSKLSLKILLSRIESAKKHWSSKVRSAAIESFNVLSKLNTEKINNNSNSTDIKKSNWIIIARIVKSNDKSFDLSAKINDIMYCYNPPSNLLFLNNF